MPNTDPIRHIAEWMEGRVRSLTSHGDRMLRLFQDLDKDEHLDSLISARSKRRAYMEALDYIKEHYPKKNSND